MHEKTKIKHSKGDSSWWDTDNFFCSFSFYTVSIFYTIGIYHFSRNNKELGTSYKKTQCVTFFEYKSLKWKLKKKKKLESMLFC